MQIKGMCPRLKDVAVAGMDLLSEAAEALSSIKEKKNQCMRCYIDGLFAFFFSTQRTVINVEDAKWFLEITNKYAKVHLPHAVATSDDTSPFVNCASLNVFKLYLSRILGIARKQAINPQVDQNHKINYFHPIYRLILLIYLYMQIKEMIVEVLKSQGDCSPGPYIPTFYQLESSLHIHPIQASKVRLLATAHTYQ